MPNPFEDKAQVMTAAGETCDGSFNQEQFMRYGEMIGENVKNVVKVSTFGEAAKGLADLIGISIGALYSMGVDPQAVWDEVNRSYLSKFAPVTKKGKPAYTPPDLTAIVAAAKGLPVKGEAK